LPHNPVKMRSGSGSASQLLTRFKVTMSRQRAAGHSWLGIRDILSESLKQADFDPKVSTDWAEFCWALAVGKEIAAVSNVNKVTAKTLYVEVAGKEWMSALEALKSKIIGEIRRQAGFEALTQIIFKEAPDLNSIWNHSQISGKNKTHLNSNPDAAQGSPRLSKRLK
jgi:Dna[CI] antecedent, DciA